MNFTEVDEELFREWALPPIDAAGDKEQRGSLLLVAGSNEIPGAAVLSADAAFRAGAGKVTIVTGRSVAGAIAQSVPEARVVGLSETGEGGLVVESADQMSHLANQCGAALIGPGLVDRYATGILTSLLLKSLAGKPVVLDALSMETTKTGLNHEELIVTPHAGEMANLMACRKDEVSLDSMNWALRLARQIGATVALKGSCTWIAHDGKVWRHELQNPGLGLSGSGDVLAGIIAGLLARGVPSQQATVWGVAVHAAAGEMLRNKIGPVGFLARELPRCIPACIAHLDALRSAGAYNDTQARSTSVKRV